MKWMEIYIEAKRRSKQGLTLMPKNRKGAMNGYQTDMALLTAKQIFIDYMKRHSCLNYTEILLVYSGYRNFTNAQYDALAFMRM